MKNVQDTQHPTWYAAGTGNHQGLVIEEETGRNVAVAYDKKDTPLLSAAPELLEACERGLDVAKSLNAIMALDGGPTDFAQQAIATISAAIAKATGKE